ncbi:MAG: hypothetical protein J5705_03430 [Bacteroidaceae bacterium]|nr:hypothetical protein [Bacteroidaceae bacterium]
MSQDKESTGKSRTRKSTAKTKTPEQEQTLKIEVSRFGSIVKALTGEKWWRLMISVFFIGCIVFAGIALVAVAIKKLYPYSDITTNGLGATTIKSEKGEVSYWLFNTASLWANSGIPVERGDIITIRSSGKYHSAIHHLYDATKYNTVLKEDWIGSEGLPDNPNDNSGDHERSKFRIFPGLPSGALVMQVANNKPFDTPKDKDANPDNFYYIGKESQHIYINNPGTLYFAVNDIVLNENNILDMLKASVMGSDKYKTDSSFRKKVDYVANHVVDEDTVLSIISKLSDEIVVASIYYKKNSKNELEYIDYIAIWNSLFECAEKTNLEYLKNIKNDNDEVENQLFNTIEKNITYDFFDSIRKECKDTTSAIGKQIFKRMGIDTVHIAIPTRIDNTIYDLVKDFGRIEKEPKDSVRLRKTIDRDLDELKHQLTSNRAVGVLKLGVTNDEFGETVCELEYYNRKNYKTAWFDDNVGSLLLIIEKEP